MKWITIVNSRAGSTGCTKWLANRGCMPLRWRRRPNSEAPEASASEARDVPWLTWWWPRSLSTDPSCLESFPPPWCTRDGEVTACALCLWPLEPSRGSLTQMLWPVWWHWIKTKEKYILHGLFQQCRWLESMSYSSPMFSFSKTSEPYSPSSSAAQTGTATPTTSRSHLPGLWHVPDTCIPTISSPLTITECLLSD